MTPETEALIARVRGSDAKRQAKNYDFLEQVAFQGELLELTPQLATALEAAEKRADEAEAKLKESYAFFEDAIGEQIIQAKMWKGHYAGDPEGQKDEAFWDGQERAFEMCLNLVKSALTKLEP